jgi:hypothetical protein
MPGCDACARDRLVPAETLPEVLTTYTSIVDGRAWLAATARSSSSYLRSRCPDDGPSNVDSALSKPLYGVGRESFCVYDSRRPFSPVLHTSRGAGKRAHNAAV